MDPMTAYTIFALVMLLVFGRQRSCHACRANITRLEGVYCPKCNAKI